MPSGNPLTTAVAKCPNPATKAPSIGPNRSATKKPGAESKARLLTGLGISMSEPAALRAVKMASLAARMAGEVLSMMGVGLGRVFIFHLFAFLFMDKHKSVCAHTTAVVRG
jgi:hypothetical protein